MISDFGSISLAQKLLTLSTAYASKFLHRPTGYFGSGGLEDPGMSQNEVAEPKTERGAPAAGGSYTGDVSARVVDWEQTAESAGLVKPKRLSFVVPAAQRQRNTTEGGFTVIVGGTGKDEGGSRC